MLRSSAGHRPKVDEVTLYVVRTEADVDMVLSTRLHVSASGTHRDLDINLLPLEGHVLHSSIERKNAGIDGVTLSLWRTATRH